MGAFGLGALIWRARFAHRGLPCQHAAAHAASPLRLASAPDGVRQSSRSCGCAREPSASSWSCRIPRIRIPGRDGRARPLHQRALPPYRRLVVRRAARTVLHLGVRRSRGEDFQRPGNRSRTLGKFLFYSTPEFVYFIIPIAVLLGVLVTFGMLSRTSELTVMKACGISLYRTALPIIVLSLVGSAAHFRPRAARPRAEAKREAEAHRRPDPRAAAADPESAQSAVDRRPRRQHLPLRLLRSEAAGADVAVGLQAASRAAWRLATQTFATSAEYRRQWTALKGLGARLHEAAAAVPVVRSQTAAARDRRTTSAAKRRSRSS